MKNMPAQAHSFSLRKVAVLILVGLLTPPQCHQRHQQRSGAAHAFSLGVVNPLRRTASTVSLRVQPSTASTAGAASSFVPIPSAPSTFFNNELFKSSEKALLHWPNGFNAETRTPRCPIIASGWYSDRDLSFVGYQPNDIK